MQPLSHLETALRLAWEARTDKHPSGVSLHSYFVRAPTRGRRRSDLEIELLFPQELQERLDKKSIALAMDPRSYRVCALPQPTVPVATREWLAEAALALGKAEGFALMWPLLHATSELEGAAMRLLGPRTPRAVIRQVLHGVGPRALRVEPFAAFVVRVLKIAQAIYAAFRHAGAPHAAAWEAVQDRLWAPHPTGRRTVSGAAARGAYLPSLLQAASGHARKRMRRSTEARRTQDDARALLARFASGPALQLWPWLDEGNLLPHGEPALPPELAGLCFFVLLTHTASERRARGGPAGGLARPFADAGFSAGEWLPDRTDDLAVRLLAAALPEGLPRSEMLDALSVLLRATLQPPGPGIARTLQEFGVKLAEQPDAVFQRARDRLPLLLRWLEENARELLERT